MFDLYCSMMKDEYYKDFSILVCLCPSNISDHLELWIRRRLDITPCHLKDWSKSIDVTSNLEVNCLTLKSPVSLFN